MQYLTAFATTAGFFMLMWAVSRMLGKHLIRRLTLFDFISAITLGSLTASALGQNSTTGAMAFSIVLWAAMALLFDWLDLTGKFMHSFLNGEPTILIENGKIMEHNLRRARLTLSGLESMLRQKGYFEVGQVEFAILETSGKISVLPKSQYRPVRPADLRVPTSYEGLSTQVMQEGKPILPWLKGIGLDEAWLDRELQRQGVARSDEVFSAWVTSDGRLVVDRYRDQPH